VLYGHAVRWPGVGGVDGVLLRSTGGAPA
jgi:hypothetical protein